MKHFLLAAGLVVSAAATAAFGQCQGAQLSVNEEVHAAGSALVGTVETAQFVPDSGTHQDGVNYTLRVDRILHGKLVKGNEVTIFSENSAEKFPMQVGKQYLLFVHLDDARYTVNNCGNSGLLEAAAVENTKQLMHYAKSN